MVYMPVSRWVLWPDVVVDAGGRPDIVEEEIDPSLLPLQVLLQLGAISFQALGAGFNGVCLLLLLRQLEEFLPDLL